MQASIAKPELSGDSYSSSSFRIQEFWEVMSAESGKNNMAKEKSNPDDNSDPQRPMNPAKYNAISIEQRLKEVAMYETSQGNRLRTTTDQIFDQANIFRHMIQCGIFQDIDEVETTVFERWGLDLPPATLEFATVDPPSGG